MKLAPFFVLTFSLLLVVSFSFSQKQVSDSLYNSNFEFGIVLDDIFARHTQVIQMGYWGCLKCSSYNNDYYEFKPNYPKVGFAMKRYFGNSALRTKISYGSRRKIIDDKENEQKNKYDHSMLTFSIGYEFHKTVDRTQFFAGVDLLYRKLEGIREHIYFEQGTKSKYTDNITSYGVRPLLGAKYFISPLISVSTEFSLYMEKFDGEEVYEYSENPLDEKTEIGGAETRFGPLGQLSVNVHF